jgi:adenine-specific DNA-methyltransferase
LVTGIPTHSPVFRLAEVLDAMTSAREKFQNLLRELFQIQAAAELDFGIYRIMGQKRGVIERFIDKELLSVIESELKSGALKEEADVATRLAEIAEQIRENIDDDAIDAEGQLDPAHHKTKLGRQYLALQQKAPGAQSIETREATIYNHLFHFFSRYYDKGDFMSLRRYSKREKYAIPYNGEEVYLHWANADQYYVKTSETLTDYRWKDPSGNVRVRFTVTKANVPQDNIKAPDKRFFLPQLDGVTVEAMGKAKDKNRHTLVTVPFHYRGLTADETQTWETVAADRNIKNGNNNGGKLQAAVLAVAHDELPTLDVIKENQDALAALIGEHHKDADGNPVSRLAHHLRRFTVKNTSDYFIHKDLAGFLIRELDFYLKNEVLQLDALEAGGEARAEGWFQMMRIIRRIGGKIIQFLAQIENFQKRLFEKKKFVTEYHYCLTLDRVPESLYPEIASNKEQVEEWKKLFAIDEAEGWSEPPTERFLKANWNLVVDTSLFPESFWETVQEALASDESLMTVDGTLVAGDNHQGLSLLSEVYRANVATIYIDPPYNTDASPILYKNGYKSSTWNSLVAGRIELSKPMLRDDGVFIAAIDDEQQRELSFILTQVFDDNLLGTICVRANPSGRPKQTGYSVSHDYLFFAGMGKSSKIGRLPPTEKQMARFSERDGRGVFEWRNLRREGSNSDRDARRRLYYPIYITESKIRVPRMTWKASTEEWIIEEKPKKSEMVVYPVNESGDEKTWRWEHLTVTASVAQLAVRRDRSGKDYVYYKRRPHEEGVVAVSSWFDAKYSATEYGTAVIKNLFGESCFSYPKSVHAVSDSIYVGGCSPRDSVVVDCFAGSGTTGHAVLNLNRLDGGTRSYVLIEQGQYFYSVLIPRLKKVIYSPEWKDGKPTARDTGIGHCFKWLRLESYEDALGNIAFNENEAAQRQFNFDEYCINYMLAFETGESETLLNIEKLTEPFDYKIEICNGDESVFKNVDLPETFNFLIGLRVRSRKVCYRETGKQKIKYIVLRGRTNPHATGGEREVVVIWRTTKDWKKADFEADKKFVEESEFAKDADEVFVNSDSLIKGAKSIDPVFKRRMFNAPD